MDKKFDENPFDELPEALVEEMLNQCDNLGESLSKSFQRLYDIKTDIRKELVGKNLLKRDTEISSTPTHPTTCGVDGSYAIERLLSTDMVAMAGVAIEGLTPPTERRHWPKPHHDSKVLSVSHNESTTVVARAIMMCMELELAAKAPHDVIFLDGSLTTPFIYFNQALNQVNEVSYSLSAVFHERLQTTLESYKVILLSTRTDKLFAGAPKYTKRRKYPMTF